MLSLPGPAMAARVRYTPALPVARDQLTQRTPMDWVITVHCVYPTRFWRDDGLSAQVTSDAGVVRVTADTSPPSGSSDVLVGFIAGAAARRLAPVTRAERRVAVLADFVRYFGPRAAVPLSTGSIAVGRTPSRAVPLGVPGPQALDCLWPCPAGAHRGPAPSRGGNRRRLAWHDGRRAVGRRAGGRRGAGGPRLAVLPGRLGICDHKSSSATTKVAPLFLQVSERMMADGDQRRPGQTAGHTRLHNVRKEK